MKKAVWLFLLIILSLPVFAQTSQPRLAVVEFSRNNNADKTLQDAVTVRNLVESRMVSTGRYEIITREEIDKLLANQQIAVSSISSAENVKKLQLQNISYIVTGSVNAMGSSYAITIKILDVSTGRFSHSADAFMSSEAAAMYNGIGTLVAGFVSGISSEGATVVPRTTDSSTDPQNGGVSSAGIGIKVRTGVAGYLFFQGQQIATLWDNDTYTIPLDKPDTYTVKMRFGDGKEISRSIVIVGRGLVDIQFALPPRNVKAGTAGVDSVPLSWESNGTGASYKVYYGTENSPARAQVYGTTFNGTTAAIPNLASNRTYYFWVSSVENGIESGKSAMVSGTTIVLAAPTGVSVSMQSLSRIAISWGAVSGAASYKIYRASSSAGPFTTGVGSSTTTAYTDTELTAETTYWYKVSAVTNGGTEGTQSATVSGRTQWVAIPVPDTLSLVDSLTWIGNNAVDSSVYVITLRNDESIAPITLSYGGKTVNITLKGDISMKTISLNANGSLFTVQSGVTLTLDNNVTLQGRANNSRSLVKVSSGGTLIMNNGSKITGNTSGGRVGGRMYGGGVCVTVAGTFTMSGGEISGNKNSDSNGGGVYVMDGTFTISGGKISGNTSSYGEGGGVYVSDSGRYIMAYGTFTMSGGEISENTASSGGGGVYFSGGTFTMSGGEISGNTASSGGGIYVSGGTFTMSSGEISRNTSSYGEGGGVYLFSGKTTTFTKTGGTIYGSDVIESLKNTASRGNGHAVYYRSSSNSKKRDTTADTGVNLDSRTATNWER
ncbi:fibronectin type III domain-containing protein [Breznakiellaceae bacterium SP9]